MGALEESLEKLAEELGRTDLDSEEFQELLMRYQSLSKISQGDQR
jgi:cell fate (sporulation/competence/biofilm development) regulator YlbF (YheA/YmcA/DUF963 family)